MKIGQIYLAMSLTVSACSTGNPQTIDVSSGGVNVTPGLPLYFSSGVGASMNDGDTMTEQALGAMKRLEDNINTAGLGLGEVVFVRAYLAPGPDGAVDYVGWNQAWGEVFNDETSPQKPARTTVAVPLLGQPGRLIELEYVVVTREAARMAAGSEALALPVTNPNLKPFGTRTDRIYSGMGVMPGGGMYWTAGMTAPVLKADAPSTSYERRGDMFTQSRNTLLRLKDNLAGVGLTLADVVYVRAFIGPDAGGKFDYDGWNNAYGEFFNNDEQPHKPARTTVTTPAFFGLGALIEIEFIAAFPNAPALFDGPEAGPRPKLRAYGAPTARVSSGVAVKPETALYFSGGTVPTVGGDIKTQALSALESLRSRLAEVGVGFKDVVFLRAYVPTTDEGFDLTGWQEAYATFFNNPGQPHKSARTTIQVHSLPNFDWKIAIDVVAVVP